MQVTGLVDRPKSLSLDELKKMRHTELVFGFECSGNRRPLQGLSSNGRWTGVPLKAVLDLAGVKAKAREFVFFGADHGEEEVDFRGVINKVDQQFGRSLPREIAMAPEPMLAYALNGEPLTRHQGFPLRLLVPGWYGVAHVKWLSNIHVQEDPYLGKFQARWYRTLNGEMIAGQMTWKESAITRMQLKSFIARVTSRRRPAQSARRGTERRHADQIGGGPRGRRSMAAGHDGSRPRAASTPGSCSRTPGNGATPGEHTIVSRVTDVTGRSSRPPKTWPTRRPFSKTTRSTRAS